jgi:hypothetical protein
MSGMTKDEIVDLTGYPADLVLRICNDAGVSGTEPKAVARGLPSVRLSVDPWDPDPGRGSP